jgi:multiple sugar transport system substrate-binding protein
MVNLTGYMPGNAIAVETTELLGSFYGKNPNHKTSIDQLRILTEWASFPGDNSLKIIEIMKTNTEYLITRRQTAEETMPLLVKEVVALLPPCAGQ